MQILLETGKSFVSATLVDSKGSTPRTRGGRILVTEFGLFSGTVGGGLLEAKAVKFSQDFLKETQDDEKVWTVDGGTGCKSNSKDSFRINFASPNRITDDELPLLMMT